MRSLEDLLRDGEIEQRDLGRAGPGQPVLAGRQTGGAHGHCVRGAPARLPPAPIGAEERRRVSGRPEVDRIRVGTDAWHGRVELVAAPVPDRPPVSLRMDTATVVDASGASVSCGGWTVVVSFGASANTATPITFRLLLPVSLSKTYWSRNMPCT